MQQAYHSVLQVISSLPEEFSRWATSMSDTSFRTIMVGGVVVLTFVLARALR